MRISASAGDTYRLCPRKFRFQYVDGLPIKPSPHLFLGTQVHAALRWFFERPLPERTWERLERVFRRNWRDDPERGRSFSNREEERRFGLEGLAYLRAFFDGEDTAATPLWLEEWVEMPLDGGHVLVGRVDRVDQLDDGRLEVIDYKTGRPPHDDRFALRDLGPQVYPVAVEETTGRRVGRMTLLYLREGRRVSYEPSPADLEAARAALIDLADTISGDSRFVPRAGRRCRWCDFLDRCPEGQAYVAGAEVAAAGADDLPF